ncbi:hypothetical protein D3C72_1943540 [compost metagenome]
MRRVWSNDGWARKSETVSVYLPSKYRRWLSVRSKLTTALTLLRSKPGCRSATELRSAKSQLTQLVVLGITPS